MTTVSEDTTQKLSAEEQLEAMLFQFLNLYERWSEDRQVAAKQGLEFAKLAKQFSLEVKHFENIEGAIIEKLEKSLHEIPFNLAKQIQHATQEAVHSVLDSSLKRIHVATVAVEKIATDTQNTRWLYHLKILMVNVLCSLAVSSFAIWYLT